MIQYPIQVNQIGFLQISLVSFSYILLFDFDALFGTIEFKQKCKIKNKYKFNFCSRQPCATFHPDKDRQAVARTLGWILRPAPAGAPLFDISIRKGKGVSPEV